MNVEFWNSLFQWGSVGLIAVTFFVGAGALWTGNRINARQTERILRLEKDLTDAKTALSAQQERTAKALLLIQDALAPRRIVMGDKNGDKEVRQSKVAVVAKYAGTVAIIQSVADPEAQTLAADIAHALTNSGWRPAIVAEAESRIPQALIREGVQVVTREASPFKYGPPPTVTMEPVTLSPASAAARALVELLDLDLGRQPFGVRWSPEYVGEQMDPIVTGQRFKFPKGAVVILVGLRPMEFLQSHVALTTK